MDKQGSSQFPSEIQRKVSVYITTTMLITKNIQHNILCSEWVPFNQERENERTVFFIAMEEIIK